MNGLQVFRMVEISSGRLEYHLDRQPVDETDEHVRHHGRRRRLHIRDLFPPVKQSSYGYWKV